MLTDPFAMSAVFGLGAVIQVAILLRPAIGAKGFRFRLALAVIGGSFALVMALGQPRPGSEQVAAAFMAFAVYFFVVLASYVFTTEILPGLSESSLLIRTLVFWYLWASIESSGGLREMAMVIAVAPTVLVFMIGLLADDWNPTVRLLSYVWFLLATVAVGVMMFQIGDLAFIGPASHAPANPIGLFVTGMAFALIPSNVGFLVALIPPEGWTDKESDRGKEWRALLRTVAGRFADYALKPGEAVSTIGVLGGVLGLSLWLHWPAVVVASFALIVAPPALGFVFQHPSLPVLAEAVVEPAPAKANSSPSWHRAGWHKRVPK